MNNLLFNTMDKEVLKLAVEFIKPLEGYRCTPYSDLAGVRTIGYGSTSFSGISSLSQDDATLLLLSDVLRIYLLYKQTDWYSQYNPYQKVSLISLAYNVGFSAVNKSNIVKWSKALLTSSEVTRNDLLNMVTNSIISFCKSKGRIIKGLQNRRKIEVDLFNKPYIPH